jgi:hypothetical protein
MKASGFALAGALLTFFGFMHGEQIGLGQTPTVAMSYLVISGIFVACAKFATVTARPVRSFCGGWDCIRSNRFSHAIAPRQQDVNFCLAALWRDIGARCRASFVQPGMLSR